jgi:hypothetical protein
MNILQIYIENIYTYICMTKENLKKAMLREQQEKCSVLKAVPLDLKEDRNRIP